MNERVFVMAGATGAFGWLAARAFAEHGASLAFLSKDQDKLDALARDLNLPSNRLLTRAVDLLDPQALRDSAATISAKFGRVDALIQLVGGWTGGKTLAESGADELKFMFDQHAWTTFHLIRAFLPALQSNGWGRIIAVSSPLATSPSAKMGPYAAGKAAQEALLLALADEFNGTNLTANIIQVRSIDVDGKGKGTAPGEIIAAMLYLCSDEAAKVNGARIPVY
jgi:NAD(P)-dependent dehydrogenase (short-subunit alcohol dehydrogenase family)